MINNLKKKLLFVVAILLTTASAPEELLIADVVLINGNIITAEKIGDRAEAIAIKDGKIIVVGSNDAVRQVTGKATKVIDLKNKTVVPGFNDAHLHPSPVYDFESPHAIVDIGPEKVNSFEDLVRILKKKADITPEGLPIIGRGYQDTKLGGHPTREILDKVSLVHPVIIRHSSGHISAVNSYVLKLANINKNTPDPPGGSFDRDKAREPNGVCRESALREFYSSGIMKKPAPPSEEEELKGYRRCFEEYIANGITSITEAGSSMHKMELYKKLQAQGLSLKINLLISESYLDEVVGKGIRQGYGDDNLKISGIKVFHGNSLSGRTCWLHEPYDMINPETGKKDYFGIRPKRTQAELDSLFLKINSAGLQIACHSNGDREIDMVLTSIERSQEKLGKTDFRNRIEHCSVANDTILNRVKNARIVPVFHSYVYEHGDKMIVYGKERQKMMHPNRTAIDMGIQAAQHSDSPVSAAIPLLRIQSLSTCKSAEGIVIGENQRILPEEAIRLWTYGGAYASFEENSKGTLSAGKSADLVILSEDPIKKELDFIKDIQVLQTMINGKVVFNRIK